MAIVDVDDSFKRPGTIPFSWEIRPGVPKTRPGNNNNNTTTTNLLLLNHPHKKLSPLRLKPLSHSISQPLLLLPPALSPPSSSFISNTKTRSLSSPLTPPSFSTTPSKLKPPPPSHGGFYSPGPSFRSSPRAFSERWQNRVKPEPRHDFVDVAAGLRWQNRVKPEPRQDFFDVAGLGCFPRLRKKNKNGGRRWENEYCSDMEMMSPWNVSSRRSVSPRWDSPKSSFSSLRFSPRIANEAEWVGFGLF